MSALGLLLLATFSASLLGGLIPSAGAAIERLGAKRILAFRSGLLIAVALAEVLPEAWRAAPLAATLAALGALLLGLRLHHGHGAEHAGHELTHPHIHENDRSRLAFSLCALLLHSLVDGLNLGAVSFVGGSALLAVGAATSLHKLADGFTLTSLFHRTEHSRAGVLAWLAAMSLVTPLGAILGRVGVLSLGPTLSALLLGFAGGSFLFVGGAQIAPQWRREGERSSRWAFAAGLCVMLLLQIVY